MNFLIRALSYISINLILALVFLTFLKSNELLNNGEDVMNYLVIYFIFIGLPSFIVFLKKSVKQ